MVSSEVFTLKQCENRVDSEKVVGGSVLLSELVAQSVKASPSDLCRAESHTFEPRPLPDK